jgi:hypothetical protein
MKTFNAQDGQSVLDVVLNTYGTMDKLVKLMQDNAIPGVLSKPVTAQKFLFDDTQIANQALRTTWVVGNAPISSLFGSGYGRLVDGNGGGMVSSTGSYCVTFSTSGLALASGTDTGGTTTTDFLAADFLTSDFL